MLGVWQRGFVGNSFFTKYTQKYRVVEFPRSIITLKLFYVKSLSFDPDPIVTRLSRYFLRRFCDQKIHISVSCAIINIENVILGPSNSVLYRSTEI